MPGDLILDSLEIKNYRGFRELLISRLGRVNLIVGRNNVGKSTLLEALRIFAKPASPDVLLDILASRNEIHPADVTGWNANLSELPVHSLFNGWDDVSSDGAAIVITSANSRSAGLVVKRYVSSEFTQLVESVLPNGQTPIPGIVKQLVLEFRLGQMAGVIHLGSAVFQRTDPRSSDPGNLSRRPWVGSSPLRELPCCYAGPDGLDLDEIGRMWDKVSLSDDEIDVLEALRIISPGVHRIGLIANDGDFVPKTTGRRDGGRIPFVKMKEIERPIPLRTLGDGVVRIFGIALATVNAKGGLLLVDEIENGIHYSVQSNLWRMVFRLASRLNVQVFATTHSLDCIKAFEEAARESEEEGVLIRLARKGDRTLVGEFDENELGIAVEGQIEVR